MLNQTAVLTLLFLAACSSADAPPITTGAAVVHVDTTVTYQTWRGWAGRLTGGTDQAGIALATRQAVVQDAVQRSGLTAMGMNVGNQGGVWDSVSMDRDVREWVVPFQAAAGSGFRFTVRIQGPPMDAATVQRALTYFRSLGVEPDLWIVKNEPDIGTKLPEAQLADAIVATCGVFQTMGAHTKVSAPTLSTVPGSITYATQLLADSRLTGCLDEISFHQYGSWTPADVKRISGLGLPSMMDEHHGAALTELLTDLENGLTAWQRDGLVGTGCSGCYSLYASPDGVSWFLNQSGAYQRQFSFPIRPGMHRVDVVNDLSRVHAVAFVGGGRYAVVALVQSAGPVAIDGLPAGSYHVMTTLGAGTFSGAGTRPDGNDAVDGGMIAVDTDGVLRTSLSGQGVVSVWR